MITKYMGEPEKSRLHESESYRNLVQRKNDEESIKEVAKNIAADLAANREELKMLTERYNEHFLDEIMRDDGEDNMSIQEYIPVHTRKKR